MFAQCKVFHCHGASIESTVNPFLKAEKLSLDQMKLTIVPIEESDRVYVVLLYNDEPLSRPVSGKF